MKKTGTAVAPISMGAVEVKFEKLKFVQVCVQSLPPGKHKEFCFPKYLMLPADGLTLDRLAEK